MINERYKILEIKYQKLQKDYKRLERAYKQLLTFVTRANQSFWDLKNIQDQTRKLEASEPKVEMD